MNPVRRVERGRL